MHVGEEIGPQSFTELRKKIALGYVTAETRVRSVSPDSDWTLAGDVPSLWNAIPATEEASNSTRPRVAPHSALRTSADIVSIWAILTGCIGATAVVVGIFAGSMIVGLFGCGCIAQAFASFIATSLISGFADLLAGNDRQIELLSEIAQNLKPGSSAR